MTEEDKPEKRLIQEKIARMLQDGVLEASDIMDGEPLLRVTEKGLRERMEEEISEQNRDGKEIIAALIDRFQRSDSSYGEITSIEGDAQSVYVLLRNYLCQKKMDLCAIKVGDKILLSRTNLEFEIVQEAVKTCSVLVAKRDMIELWDDAQNNILHLFITPLRKHFPIAYGDEKSKLETIERLLADSTKML